MRPQRLVGGPALLPVMSIEPRRLPTAILPSLSLSVAGKDRTVKRFPTDDNAYGIVAMKVRSTT